MILSRTFLALPSTFLGLALGIRPPGPNPCAVSCQSALRDGGVWSHVHDLPHLNACEETTVFRTGTSKSLNGTAAHFTLQSCTVSENEDSSSMSGGGDEESLISLERGCTHDPEISHSKVSLQLTYRGPSVENSGQNVVQASGALSTVLQQASNCETTALFAKSGGVIIGLYSGAAVDKESAMGLIDILTAELESNPRGGQVSVQLCGGRLQSSLVAGVFVDYSGDLAAVHEAVHRWSNALCVSDFDHEESLHAEMGFLPIRSIPLAGARARSTNSGGSTHDARSLVPRAECEAVEVVAGDGCWSLGESCGITEDELRRYNPIDNLCDVIVPGQYLCCSEGTLPDFSPQPDADGNCFAHTARDGDTCWILAQEFSLTVEKIEEFNRETWGWAGCDAGIQIEQVLCLSSGKAPMPTIIENAQCGPQKPGTTRPPDGTNLEEMNPCPLNACCSGWGFCGTTSDFCTPAPADTGAPGAKQPEENGCFSNCGTDIINNDVGPAEFVDLVYFEAWNLERPCAHLDVLDISDRHTRIHFAFVDITPDFKIDTTSVQAQFDRFLKLDSAQRIVSFGGWAFSTENPTYRIFRQGVAETNRETLATSVVNFIMEHDLDGVDFDWEYPGAPDLPDIEPDDPRNGIPYLEFLRLVREKLPREKSLAIAAPASFWYLKAFPIKEIAEVVDYIVYMTYDLHGQWDHRIWWASPGCSERDENRGNCLRSHINMTETENSLSMITKAGVPSNKILVGITSYGRSFKMEQAGCTGPLCRFAGIGEEFESAALPGVCTETAGYVSEYEIRDIIAFYESPEVWDATELGELEGDEALQRTYLPEGTYRAWYDNDSESDILVYAETEWVAWMDTNTKRDRVERYRQLNFAGVSDWAVDLAGGLDYSDEEELAETAVSTCDSSLTFDDLSDLESSGGDLDSECAALHTLKVLIKMFTEAIDKYRAADGNYDRRFGYYVKAMRELANANLNKCLSWHDDGPCNAFFTCTWQDDGDIKASGQCPLTDYDLSEPVSFTVVYELDDEDGFNRTLENDYGVTWDWVEFKDSVAEDKCNGSGPPPGAGPRPAGNDTLGRRQCIQFRQEYKQRPAIREDAKIPNPKEIIEEAAANFDDMILELEAAYIELSLGMWEGNSNELVEALSMPVLSVVQSVELMKQVEEIGEEVERQEREAKTKETILNVLLVAFIFIPIAGEAALALGWTSVAVARLGVMIGVVGDGALTVYGAVEDPKSALLTAFLMLIPGVRIPRNKDMVKEIISKKRNGGSAALDAMGDLIKKHDTSIQNIVNVCRSR